MRDLRKDAGKSYPLGLAGFPYVSYHLSFPYSVFLGPGGAQYDAPQMYWSDIGTSVADVYSVTYSQNEIYRRPVFPIGELYPATLTGRFPPITQIEQFNTLARRYRAHGTSWYDWQSATGAGLAAISKYGTAPAHFKPTTTAMTVAYRQEGDLVIWAQEYLDGWLGRKFGASAQIAVDGDFGKLTRAAVKLFQADHHIDPTGIIDGTTWDALLKVKPASVTWVSSHGKLTAKQALTAARRRPGELTQPLPVSAKLRARRNELHGNVGQGRP